MSSHPIGIFDSGVGGLTVMQELTRTLPLEQFIYFGDTARLPYGNKSRSTVIRYCIENTLCLMEKEIKLLVVACNTATALALKTLKELFPIPIVGVIEPGAKKAVSMTRNQKIAILGTKGTIASGAYQSAISQLSPKIKIFAIACPLFVPLVEEQWLHHNVTSLVIGEYLEPIQTQNIDTLLLGCTHYPLLRPLIQDFVGDNVQLVDSAATCANQVAYLLQEHHLLSSHRQGDHQYYVSDDPDQFQALAEHLFGHPIKEVDILLADTKVSV